MNDALLIILLTVVPIGYIAISIAFMQMIYEEGYYTWTIRIFIDKFNLSPLLRIVGIIFCGLSWLLTFVLGGLILILTLIFVALGYGSKFVYEGSSIVLCWILLGRTKWKKTETEEDEHKHSKSPFLYYCHKCGKTYIEKSMIIKGGRTVGVCHYCYIKKRDEKMHE